MKKTSIDMATAESIAAIAFSLAMSPKSERAYKAALANVDGFVGFYSLTIEAAGALETVARRKRVRWGETADWILTTSNFGTLIIDYMIKRGISPQGSELTRLAASSIQRW